YVRQAVLQGDKTVRRHRGRIALLRGERDGQRAAGADRDLDVDRLGVPRVGEVRDRQRASDVGPGDRVVRESDRERAQRDGEPAEHLKRQRGAADIDAEHPAETRRAVLQAVEADAWAAAWHADVDRQPVLAADRQDGTAELLVDLAKQPAERVLRQTGG